MDKYLRRMGSGALSLLASACSVNRPVPVAEDAASLRAYLAEHPVANLRVTDRAGHRYWIHAPEVRGDSLVGRHGYDQPGRPLGVAIGQIADLRTGHFNAGRTSAVVGGVLAAAGVAILLVADDAHPAYWARRPTQEAVVDRVTQGRFIGRFFSTFVLGWVALLLVGFAWRHPGVERDYAGITTGATQ